MPYGSFLGRSEDESRVPLRHGRRTSRALRRGSGRRDRHHGYPAAEPAGHQQVEHRVRLRRRLVGGRRRREERAPPDERPGRQQSGVLARRHAGRLHRAVRGERRRLRRAGRGRRADPADLPPGARRRSGFHTGRNRRGLHLAARGVQRPLHADVHRAGEGGLPDAGRTTVRLSRCLLAGRQAHRLQPALRRLHPVEALPRRHAFGDLALHGGDQGGRGRPAAAGPAERRLPDVDWRHGLLPLGPGRRVQPVLVRREVQGRQTADRSRGLPDSLGVGRRREDHLRAGRLPARLRPVERPAHEADGRRDRRPARHPAAVRQGRPLRSRGVSLAVGRARRRRVPRRDRDGAGREGRPAQHHGDARRARAVARLVAGRQVDRLLLGRRRRVPTRRRAAGRQGRGEELQAGGRGLLRPPGLLARQQEDRLHRQFVGAVLDRPGDRRVEEDRVRAGLRAGHERSRPRGRPTRSGSPTRWARAPTSSRCTSTRSIRTSRSRSPTA